MEIIHKKPLDGRSLTSCVLAVVSRHRGQAVAYLSYTTPYCPKLEADLKKIISLR